MKIELNDEEAKVLVNLIDVAVKSAGLQAAASALHFINKIDAAVKEEAATASTAPDHDAIEGDDPLGR